MRSLSVAFGSLAIFITAACAPKEQAKTDSPAAGAQTAASADPPVVTVHAKDFAFNAPDQIPAGMTTFKLVNDGPNFHHLVIVRLDSGKTAADFGEAMKKQGPPPAWAVIVGGPNGPDPTKESNATLELQPGNYVMLCFVDIPDHIPHAARGMVHPFTVTPATGPVAAAPTADVSLTLSEYNFQLSQPITAGPHTIKVTNAGTQDHEVELVKLAPGKKVDDLLKWGSAAKPQGPPPASGIGGAIVGRGAGPVTFKADFTAGDYAFVCFIPDSKDGKPHFAHGMVQSFTVQ